MQTEMGCLGNKMESFISGFLEFGAELGQWWEVLATIGAILAAGFTAGIFYLNRKNKDSQKAKDYKGLLERAKEEAKRQEQIANDARAQMAKQNAQLRKYNNLKETLLGRDTDLWTLHEPSPYDGYDRDILSKKLEIMTVMNLKGGVGKTTIATNLAAYYEKVHKRKVLLVDLDFQASATTAILNLSGLDTLDIKGASHLFSGDRVEQIYPSEVIVKILGDRLPKTKLIPCSYSFSGAENRLMVSWLLKETEFDPRYALSRFLHLEGPLARFDYDTVIIDAPPRLSLGAINALTASSTVIIPTLPDRLSSEAVENFISNLNSIAPVLNQGLDKILIAMNRTSSSKLSAQEEAIVQQLQTFSEKWEGKSRVLKTNLPGRAAFANATYEKTLAWFQRDGTSPPIQSILHDFGDEVSREIGLRVPERELSN